MKKRSLNKILILNILTLGFYEYYWLFETRKEIVAKYNVKILRIWKLLVPFLINIFLFSALIVIFLYYIPQNNKKTESIKQPTPECYLQYGASNGNVGADGLTQKCKDEVDNFYAVQDKTTNSTNHLLILSGFLLILIFIFSTYYYKWYKSYASAVAQIIGGGATTNSLFIGINYAPVLTMITLQTIFNNIESTGAHSLEPNLLPSSIAHKYIKYIIPYAITTLVLYYLAGILVYSLFFK